MLVSTEFLISRISVFLLIVGLLAGCRSVPPDIEATPDTHSLEMINLGQTLFFDPNLSQNRTQSCSSCHDPQRAFTDGRDNGVGGAVSLGDDGFSLGDRNTPTAAYAALTPAFHKNKAGEYVGGLFHDGRAATAVDQAGDPITNPIEMALPDLKAVSERIRENPGYVAAFTELFGESIFADTKKLDKAVRESIVAFEKTSQFTPFDSRYDRYLRGEYKMTHQEDLGRRLFFSTLINCNSCHMLNQSPNFPRETFTNYKYHNIGIPTNVSVRKKNHVDIHHQDPGLLDNPTVEDPSQAGKFKVPTLRNVAVTGPYMHNGVFQELRTAVLFYNKYLVNSNKSRTNPETGQPWNEPEVAKNIDLELLQEGQPLDEHRVDSLIAFLKTLTDQRYEHLLE